MRRHVPVAIGLLSAAAMAVLPIRAAGQSADPKALPRTADGHPNLSGVYDTATLTPLERPEEFGTNLFLTEQEADAIERAEARRRFERGLPSDPATRTAPPQGGTGNFSTGSSNVGGYNNFWIDRGTSAILVDGKFRTSIITTPENGRLPGTNAAGRARQAGQRTRPTSDTAENGGTAGRGAYDPSSGRWGSGACSDSDPRPGRRRCRCCTTT